MKRLAIILFFCAVLSAGSCIAQSQQQPFMFTLYGGMFFPAGVDFQSKYRSTSDLIWGVGIGLPLAQRLTIVADEGFFSTDAYIDPGLDSSASLKEHMIHAGILLKQPLSQMIAARVSAGLNYISITQTVAGPSTPQTSTEGDKKIGYYGGVGLEELLPDLHFVVFGDLLYDYRRLHQTGLNGDFGGVRAVLGVHMILF
ncbi:MAG TPA: hypothetical protein VMW43_11285 [Bacteroidota bacterium]|nr:hypothetical protein [Bacteroidota bacterium]